MDKEGSNRYVRT